MTIEELQLLPEDSYTVLDVRRAEDFAAGSWQRAVNLPLQEIGDTARLTELLPDRGRPVYVLGYTGKLSHEAVIILQNMGYRADDVEGGFRALLRRQLSETVTEEDRRKRTAQIEHSIIKKFRRPLWSRFTRAMTDYQLLSPGDRIAVCISGGKDSMLLAKLMQELQRHGNVPFELVFLVMNPGYNPDNWAIIQGNAEVLGLDLTVFESEIFDIVADIDRNPCYLCARMRRGYLYSRAQQLGCNKIALGHHYDDVIETILMGMLYSGKVETMMPKLHSNHFPGMELIRPMYLIREADIKAWRDYNGLHFIQCACRFTENIASTDQEKTSSRDEVKKLIAQMAETNPVVEQNIFNSVRRVNLRTVLGYKKDDVEHSFLEEYEDWGAQIMQKETAAPHIADADSVD